MAVRGGRGDEANLYPSLAGEHWWLYVGEEETRQEFMAALVVVVAFIRFFHLGPTVIPHPLNSCRVAGERKVQAQKPRAVRISS
jgi:hypothetical protein